MAPVYHLNSLGDTGTKSFWGAYIGYTNTRPKFHANDFYWATAYPPVPIYVLVVGSIAPSDRVG